MKINIITRTHNRPWYFKIHKASVDMQTKKVNHIIGSDVACDYVKKYVRYPQLKSNWKQKILAGWTNWHTPRNLYINRLLDEVKTGYCIILDDDDMFLDNQAVEKIIKIIDNKKNLMVIRKVKFPNIILPRRLPPSVWDIASCGYAFDIDIVRRNNIKMWEWSWSDGIFACDVYKHCDNIKLIDEVLTGIQKTDGMHNHWTGDLVIKDI